MVRQRLVLSSTCSRALVRALHPDWKGTSTDVRKRSLKIPFLQHWLLEWDYLCWMYPRRMVAACSKEKSLTFCPQLGWEPFRGVEEVAGSHYPHSFMLCTWKELWLAGTDLPQVSLCVSLQVSASLPGERTVAHFPTYLTFYITECF